MSEASASVTFTVNLTAPLAVPVTVNYATEDGTAVAGTTGDYTATVRPPHLPGRGHVEDRARHPQGRHPGRAAETFSLRLSGATGSAIVDDLGVATINDNDLSGSLQFSAATYTVAGVRAQGHHHRHPHRRHRERRQRPVPHQQRHGDVPRRLHSRVGHPQLRRPTSPARPSRSRSLNDTLDENDETVLLTPPEPGRLRRHPGRPVARVLDHHRQRRGGRDGLLRRHLHGQRGDVRARHGQAHRRHRERGERELRHGPRQSPSPPTTTPTRPAPSTSPPASSRRRSRCRWWRRTPSWWRARRPSSSCSRTPRAAPPSRPTLGHGHREDRRRLPEGGLPGRGHHGQRIPDLGGPDRGADGTGRHRGHGAVLHRRRHRHGGGGREQPGRLHGRPRAAWSSPRGRRARRSP